MHGEGSRRLESRMSARTEAYEPRSEQPSDSIGADDEDIAIMSNSLQISDHEQSITLDDDDFESIDLLVRRAMRKPARGHNRHHGHHVPAASRRRVMSTGGLLALCFFCVCSGPLNPSEVIADDPVTGTLFLVLFPLLCSGPYAAIIAELASALPEDGGYVVWALNAFGPACAFQVGFWAWAASIFSRVYRIALAFNLVTSALGVAVASGVTFLVKAVIAIVLTLPSLLGTKALTWTLSFALLVCVVAPYAVLTGWGYSQERITSASSVKTSSGEGIDWVGLGSTVFWSFDGFHVASTAGGHVLNPARTFPHAIYFTFLTVYMLYLLPLLASFSATRDQWRQLSDWSFPSLAEQIGGTGLRSLIIAASAIGLLGMYTAQVFCEGYQLTGMADISLAPKFLRARTKRFDSPHWSIIASLVAVLAVSTCSLEYLLPVANTFAALTQLVVLAAALELRRSLPYMPRPAKVPGGIPLMLLLSLLPALLLGYLIVKTFMETETAIICGSLLALGVILGVARAFRSRRRYL